MSWYIRLFYNHIPYKVIKYVNDERFHYIPTVNIYISKIMTTKDSLINVIQILQTNSYNTIANSQQKMQDSFLNSIRHISVYFEFFFLA